MVALYPPTPHPPPTPQKSKEFWMYSMMIKIAVHVTKWFVIHQNWILACCFMIWLTEVNAFCLPSEAFESKTKSISNHKKVIHLWCIPSPNDCCACAVSAASTLCTPAMYHFQSKLLRTKFNCIHLSLYSLQKNTKVCRSCGTKGHNKSETRSKS